MSGARIAQRDDVLRPLHGSVIIAEGELACRTARHYTGANSWRGGIMTKAILLSPFAPLALMAGFPLIWPMIYWSPDSWGDFLFGAFATVMFFPFVYAYSVSCTS